MAGWRQHDGLAVALPLENVDTDQLLPARFMSVPRSDGYGPNLLHDLRFEADGATAAGFPLNLHPCATVLVARRNFGGGSSREAAVYALVDFGIRAVIAPSFGDIFAANAVNNGLLPARVAPETAEAMLAMLAKDAKPVHIDLETGGIEIGNLTDSFDLPEVARQKLINGWDDIDLTAAYADSIADFRKSRQSQSPWAWPDSSAN